MSRWWRAYDDAVDHPKLLLLSDKAHRAWFNLLCLASANGGVLPPMEVMCLKLRLKEKVVGEILEELIARDLVDEYETVLRPHDWNGRQFKSDVSTGRVQEFRERKRNVSVTPPETEEQNTETEKEVFRPKRVRTMYSEDFENGFWKPYPRTPLMSKKQAFLEWGKLSDEDRNLAIAAVPKFRAFLKSKPDHEIIHAERFLSKRRFDGFAEQESELRIVPSGFYAPGDSPELIAWDAHRGKKYPRDRNGGWHFPTQWPPGHQNSQAA